MRLPQVLEAVHHSIRSVNSAIRGYEQVREGRSRGGG